MKEALHEVGMTLCGKHSQGWRLASLSRCIHSCWLKAAGPGAPTPIGKRRAGWPRTERTGETESETDDSRYREGIKKKTRNRMAISRAHTSAKTQYFPFVLTHRYSFNWDPLNICRNSFSTFCVMIMINQPTNQPTNRHRWKHNVLGRVKKQTDKEW